MISYIGRRERLEVEDWMRLGWSLEESEDFTDTPVMDARVYVARNGDDPVPLEHRKRHSPCGFEWGYGGSGPADLALAILWDYLGREPETQVYQEFKSEVVARLDDEFELAAAEIDAWCKERSDV